VHFSTLLAYGREAVRGVREALNDDRSQDGGREEEGSSDFRMDAKIVSGSSTPCTASRPYASSPPPPPAIAARNKPTRVRVLS